MNARKFENEQEFNEWKERNLIGGVIFEFGEFDSPMMYPCIMVYEFIEEPNITNSDMEEQYDELIADDYDSEDIELLMYHYVYPTDFD
jgi:hypothetical protein